MIRQFFARRRQAKEDRRIEAFRREFDRRRALVENDPNLSRFEREMVEETRAVLPLVREYMARKNTWVVPDWAFYTPPPPPPTRDQVELIA